MRRRSLSADAWRAEGLARFRTRDARLWLFVCPSCGHEQSGRDYAALDLPGYHQYLARWCVGRFNLNVPARADQVVAPGERSVGFGCTYAPGAGDDDRNPVSVDLGDRSGPRNLFDFAPS